MRKKNQEQVVQQKSVTSYKNVGQVTNTEIVCKIKIEKIYGQCQQK